MTDTEHPDSIRVYEAADGWRWTVRAAGNHEVIAASTEAYTDRRGAVTNLERVTGRKVDEQWTESLG